MKILIMIFDLLLGVGITVVSTFGLLGIVQLESSSKVMFSLFIVGALLIFNFSLLWKSPYNE